VSRRNSAIALVLQLLQRPSTDRQDDASERQRVRNREECKTRDAADNRRYDHGSNDPGQHQRARLRRTRSRCEYTSGYQLFLVPTAQLLEFSPLPLRRATGSSIPPRRKSHLLPWRRRGSEVGIAGGSNGSTDSFDQDRTDHHNLVESRLSKSYFVPDVDRLCRLGPLSVDLDVTRTAGGCGK
jgi:hypothetical protein